MSPSLYRYLSSGDLRLEENVKTVRDFKFEGDIWQIVDEFDY